MSLVMSRTDILNHIVAKGSMENAGIEPATLCMLSTRATNCANSPFFFHLTTFWELEIINILYKNL